MPDPDVPALRRPVPDPVPVPVPVPDRDIYRRVADLEARLDRLIPPERRHDASATATAAVDRLRDLGARIGPGHPVYQVTYRDTLHDDPFGPLKTVLLAADLPPLACAQVPVLSAILSKLEGFSSVRNRRGDSMADDLIAILKPHQED